MRQALFLLLLSGFAAAACQSLPYHDFTWASDYTQPQRPPDTLIDNCRQLNLTDPTLCNLIQSPLFSEYDKKRLLLDDLAKNVRPPFSVAQSWDAALNYTRYAPSGITPQNGAYIKNAWVAITGFSLSLLKADNKTYVNDSGKVFLAYNFSFVVPRESFGSDCRTDYEVCGYNYSLNAFNNGQSLPRTGLNAAFQSNAQNNFSVLLSVNSQYLIHHYQLVRHCYGRYCRWTCDYIRAEDRRDAVSAWNNKTTFLQQTDLSATVFVDGFHDGLLDAWLRVNNSRDFNRFSLDAGNSWLELQKSEYKLEYTSTPYNPLYVASNASTKPLQFHELSILSRETSNSTETIHFLAPAGSPNCSLELVTHFQQVNIPDACVFNETQLPIINLTVANASNESFVAIANFYENFTGSPLADKVIEFKYGNQTVNESTSSEGIAVAVFNYSRGTNLVYAEFKTDFQTKSARAFAIVPAPAPDLIGIVLFWLGLAFGIWLVYLFVRRVFQ